MPSNHFLAALHVSIHESRGTHRLAQYLQWLDTVAEKYSAMLNDLYYSEVNIYVGLESIHDKQKT